MPAAALAVAVVVLVVVLATGRSKGEPLPPAAHAAANRFLDRYLAPDGRVVRHDQGGDTVSEGQAYAMLAAVATGDRPRFDRAWHWSERHLGRRDGLMSWHWQGGHVTDAQPAADADLDMARALALAGKRFGGDSYLRAARRMSSALLREETVTVRGQRVLVAGPWARHAPYPVDPSYFSPVSFTVLRKATGDRRFDALAGSSRRLASELTSGGRSLPPDWAVMDASGAARPSGPPGSGAGPTYGLDAVRLPVRFAESCQKGDRRLAAGEWPSVRGAGGDHPAATVGSAAAAHAAGDRKAEAALLAQAEAADRRASTYYGAAWIALGRIELSSKALGGCD